MYVLCDKASIWMRFENKNNEQTAYLCFYMSAILCNFSVDMFVLYYTLSPLGQVSNRVCARWSVVRSWVWDGGWPPYHTPPFEFLLTLSFHVCTLVISPACVPISSLV